MRVALFALNTVLFPGGVLPLRVFEARYMDMVRSCMKSGEPFGVVLIRKGAEIGPSTALESAGTLARIVAWDMPQFGVLHIRALGGQRFQIMDSSTQADGLKIGEVELLPADDDAPIAERHLPCVRLLERIVADLKDKQSPALSVAASTNETPAPPTEMPIQSPYRFDSSVWVGNRLAELLPTSLRAKQKLMALPDATARLDLVFDYLKQHGALK